MGACTCKKYLGQGSFPLLALYPVWPAVKAALVLRITETGLEASLYIHVPFCGGLRGKCDYCDFYSVPLNSRKGLPEPYIETILLEGERLLGKFLPGRIPSVYIGGGTPSLLGADGISRLLRGLSRLIARFSPFPPEEITVEANPESAGEAFMAAAREAGATRLSLGIQTFHAPSRRAVHRIGDERLLSECLRLAAEYFPLSFSADLLSGLPLQSEKTLLDDIAAVLSGMPGHVSLYALTPEAGTPLAAQIRRGESPLPCGEEADSLWLAGRDALEKAAYGQYEVSNFCLEGKESRHNIRYWRMRNWLALGPAASATLIDDQTGKGVRYTIPPDIDSWLASGGVFFQESGDNTPAANADLSSGGVSNPSARMNALLPVTEELDSLTLAKESFLMGFRYIEGPDEELFRRRFHRGIGECIPKTLEAWRRKNLLRKDTYALTKEGLLFLDRFLIDAFGELDASFSVC